jgi:hypothetical protein
LIVLAILLARRRVQRYALGMSISQGLITDPVTAIAELPIRVVVALAEVVDTYLHDGRYAAAKTAYTALKHQIFALSHEEVVATINRLGLDARASAHIASSWATARAMSHPELEFETAGVAGDSVGAMMAYRRRGKSAWGKLLAIREGPEVGGMCMGYWVKENNPILWRHRTRNEMKIALGRGNAGLVNTAVRCSKQDFLRRCLLRQAAGLIRERLAMEPEAFWRSAKYGDADLVAKVGKIPSPLRRQMRRSGMAVAPRQGPPPPEQLSLF